MKLKEINVDLGSLFTMSLNYNFDALKLILQDLSDNQKEMIAKTNEIEKKLIDYDIEDNSVMASKIMRLERRVRRLRKKRNKTPTKGNGDVDEGGKGDGKEKAKKEIEEEDDDGDSVDSDLDRNEELENEILKKKSMIGPAKSFFNNKKEDNKNITFQDNLQIKELEKRIVNIEKNLKLDPKKMQSFQSSTSSLTINKISTSNEYDDQLKEFNDKIANLSSALEDIAVKVNDFNVTDLFKDCQTDDGKIDAAKILVLSLESKVFKKFSLLDEKNKKIDENIFKINRELNAINVKNTNYDNIFPHFEDQFQKLFEGINKENEKILETELKLEDITIKQQNDINKLNENANKLTEDIVKLKEQLENNPNKDDQKNIGLNESDLQYIKDLFRRVNELEKALKMLIQSINMDSIRDELNQIRNALNDKCTRQDIFDLNDKITLQGEVINSLKDINAKLIEDRTKLCADVNFLLKKLEALNAAVITLKSTEEGNTNKNNIFDNSKYVELPAFQEFIKAYGKDHEKIKKDQEELKHYIDETKAALQKKASEDDLKNLEGFLIARIEELKFYCTRKFADKNETAKSIKYLDTQIKHILDVYIKKTEKAESWLIAKKPIGGFSCASCESYIGDLPEKKDYLAWNKYPLRESQDKTYRVSSNTIIIYNRSGMDLVEC